MSFSETLSPSLLRRRDSSTIRMETGSFERFGKPCSARAGREWNFPSVPEPVMNERSVFMVYGDAVSGIHIMPQGGVARRLATMADLSKSFQGSIDICRRVQASGEENRALWLKRNRAADTNHL